MRLADISQVMLDLLNNVCPLISMSAKNASFYQLIDLTRPGCLLTDGKRIPIDGCYPAGLLYVHRDAALLEAQLRMKVAGIYSVWRRHLAGIYRDARYR